MTALLIILAIVVPVTALGLWAALRHQRKFNEQQQQLRAAQPPRPPTADEALVFQARELANTLAFDAAQAVEVTERELSDNPVRWHGQSIRVVATWNHQFEGSFIGDAWVRVDGFDTPVHGAHRVRAGGVWIFPRARKSGSTPGFGHLGMSWGEFCVHELELL